MILQRPLDRLGKIFDAAFLFFGYGFAFVEARRLGIKLPHQLANFEVLAFVGLRFFLPLGKTFRRAFLEVG